MKYVALNLIFYFIQNKFQGVFKSKFILHYQIIRTAYLYNSTNYHPHATLIIRLLNSFNIFYCESFEDVISSIEGTQR